MDQKNIYAILRRNGPLNRSFTSLDESVVRCPHASFVYVLSKSDFRGQGVRVVMGSTDCCFVSVSE